MLGKLIELSVRNRLFVGLATLALIAGGLFAIMRTPLDALPDLSDVQVIVYTPYAGQAPQVVEDQVTYPLTTALAAVPRARVVRGLSMFGTSYVYVIFEDGTDIYWARSRVLEYLSSVQGRLPAGVTPQIGPDATGVGWVYQYALQGKNQSLADLRSLQDWYVRYQLTKAGGVAEVASVGGFVKEYQITVDPHRLASYGISLDRLIDVIRESNTDVGGRVVEMSEQEYMVRGLGYLHGVDDIGSLVVKAEGGTPVLVRDVARVEIVPAERRGIAELNGTGEVAAGIVEARFGQNALDVIANVKAKIKEIAAGLPSGTEIVSVYDRSRLIERAIANLKDTLVEESLIVALVCVLFLLHVRSALVAIVTLPLGVLFAFIAMRALGLGSNIMSLGGIAIAIGAMVDAAIVMIENAHKRLEQWETREAQAEHRHSRESGNPETENNWTPAFAGVTTRRNSERAAVIIAACKEVGPALFFSLLVITVSFLPVLTLEGQEGRLFAPLALTKTFAMAGAAILSVTLVPVLMTLFIKGRILPEAKNPVNRFLVKAYRPIIGQVLAHPVLTIALALAAIALTILPARQLGSEFMPTLNEGAIFYMPAALPGMSVTEAARLLQTTDRIIKTFPEVESVFGKSGHAETATDPAPLEMFETVINLKPESQWPAGMTVDKLVAEMDAALKFPGVANSWTMPIKARIDMLSTGIRTPVGVKVFGKDLATIETLAGQIEAVVKKVPGTRSAYAERVNGGYYLDIAPRRDQLARYGVTVGEFQRVVSAALGGDTVTTAVEGLERYPVSVRYPRELRDDPYRIASEVYVPTATGMVPLGQVADIKVHGGPPAIKTENGLLAAYVYVDIEGRDVGSYVDDARRAVAKQVRFPPGYYATWSGQFEYMERAKAKLTLVIPATLAIIFVLLYLNFGRIAETVIVMLSVPFALVGGIWLMWWLGYNMSVAVAVGFIALAGVAAETGVVMLIYLDQAWTRIRAEREAEGREPTAADLYHAIVEGAVERVRPKMMTVVAIMAGLLPIMWGHGTGSEVMSRIAAPMVGGMISSTVLTLGVIPALYALVKRRRLKS